MDEYRLGSHTASTIHLHIVWITKYRHKIFLIEVVEQVRAIVKFSIAVAT
jgi:Transposase and inactivated derivatives